MGIRSGVSIKIVRKTSVTVSASNSTAPLEKHHPAVPNGFSFQDNKKVTRLLTNIRSSQRALGYPLRFPKQKIFLFKEPGVEFKPKTGMVISFADIPGKVQAIDAQRTIFGYNGPLMESNIPGKLLLLDLGNHLLLLDYERGKTDSPVIELELLEKISEDFQRTKGQVRLELNKEWELESGTTEMHTPLTQQSDWQLMELILRIIVEPEWGLTKLVELAGAENGS